MEPLALVALVLLALLVGAALPALLQLRRTLRSAEEFLHSTGRKLDRVLDEVTEATGRLNRVAGSLEEGSRAFQQVFDSAQKLARALGQAQEALRNVVTVGNALGPAVAAGARALFAPAPSVDGESSQEAPQGEPAAAAEGARRDGEEVPQDPEENSP